MQRTPSPVAKASVVILAVGLTGCFSSSYAPRDPRKVYHAMRDGRRGYQHGQEFHTEYGFGGGLVDAVAGDPAAERIAHTYRDRMVGGFVATLVGSLCVPSVLAYDLGQQVGNNTAMAAPASHLVLVAGCSVLAVAGLTYLVSAVPYADDAVNIYNDDIDAAGQAFAPRLPGQPAPPRPLPAGPPGLER